MLVIETEGLTKLYGKQRQRSHLRSRQPARKRCDLNDSFEQARGFYLSFGLVVLVAVVIVLIPGAPLVPILFLTQALNAVLLLVMLPFIGSLAKDREPMGAHALGRTGRWTTGIAFGLIALGVLVVT